MVDEETVPAALRLAGVTKRFGPALVLDGVDLTLRPGEIHGLIGQNGSGKSTLIKVLSGFHRADSGTAVTAAGTRPLPLSARQLDELGIAFVHQDLGLVDTASVADNIRVGRYVSGRFSRRVRRRAEAAAAARTLARLGSAVDPDAPAGALAAADRAIVAIARALQGHPEGGGILVFDESTQSLPREVLHGFYATVRELAAGGTAILLVSHQLDEIMTLTRRVTVLKDGRVAGAGIPVTATSRRELTRLMLGADADTRRLHDAVPTEPRHAALTARSLTTRTLRGIDLEVRAGEVVGVTGTTSSGHDELPYALAGAGHARGSVSVGDARIDLSKAQAGDLVRAGLALVPQGRATHGLALSLSVQDNLSVPRLRERSGRWRVTTDWQRQEFRWAVDRLSIVPPRADLPAAALSGGNQQKVQLAKWLVAKPAVLVLHEPTQAVDIGARHDILHSVREAARDGAAVLFVSIDTEDLASACDRVLIVDDGAVIGELTAPMTADRILDAVFRHETVTQGISDDHTATAHLGIERARRD